MTIHLVETMDDVLKFALTRELPKKPVEVRDKKAAEPERPGGAPGGGRSGQRAAPDQLSIVATATSAFIDNPSWEKSHTW